VSNLPAPYYDRDGIIIYHGDCRELLPRISRADLLLTDPPYGVGRSQGFGGSATWGGRQIARRTYSDSWDSERAEAQTVRLAIARCDLAIVWGGNFFADELPRSSHWIVWDKVQVMPTFGDCELAWTNSGRKSVSKVTIQWSGLQGKERIRDHPTQKPEALMRWCLSKYSEVGQIVLDPYLGSGTTLVAAKFLERRGIGIEREEKYCEIAAERLSQQALPFESPPGTPKHEVAPLQLCYGDSDGLVDES